MSSKRKTTKPTKVSGVETEAAYPGLQNHPFPVRNSPTQISKSCSVLTGSVSINHTPTSCHTIDTSELEHEQDSSWGLSMSFSNHSEDLPTMVNPASLSAYIRSSNSSATSSGSTNSLDLLANGEDNDPLISGKSFCPPPKKTRKIRYKYQENSGVEVKYKCDVCQYCTNRSDHYKRHVIIHSNLKPLKCLTCGYGTARSDHFRRHLSRHNLSKEEITNQCQLNGIRTAQASCNNRNLNPQLVDGDADAFQQKCSTSDSPAAAAVVDGETSTSNTSSAKRYNCVLCGYSTDRNSHFVRHVKTHTDLKPYQCESCGKSFKLETYLKKHRCSALKAKPSETPVNLLDSLIGATFLSGAGSETSSNATAPNDTLTCVSCGTVFESLGGLSLHICPTLLGDL